MRSPEGNHELRELKGNASDIWDRGDAWVTLGEQMESTATELRAIGDSDVHKSKGTDKLAEIAGDSAGDLEKASIRYIETGKVLRTYGNALDVAASWINPRVETIENAEHAYQEAKQAKEDAQSDLDGLDSTMPWEDEPTDADRTKADDALTTAGQELTTAASTRDELWTTFDSKFETWSEAYDDAVDGIQKAMDSADNNDGFWEFVDTLLTVLTIVLIVLSVIALIIGAPLFGILGMIILGLTLLSIGLTALKFFTGRATLSEMLWSLAGLLPFGAGKLLRGAPALGALLRGGRGVVATAIRSALPRVSLFRPSTWGTPIRWLMAGRTARLALPRPGMLVNPFKALVSGGPEAIQAQRFLTTMAESPWGTADNVAGFITQNLGKMPGLGEKLANMGLWFADNGLNVTDLLDLQPDIPGAKDVRISW